MSCCFHQQFSDTFIALLLIMTDVLLFCVAYVGSVPCFLDIDECVFVPLFCRILCKRPENSNLFHMMDRL